MPQMKFKLEPTKIPASPVVEDEMRFYKDTGQDRLGIGIGTDAGEVVLQGEEDLITKERTLEHDDIWSYPVNPNLIENGGKGSTGFYNRINGDYNYSIINTDGWLLKNGNVTEQLAGWFEHNNIDNLPQTTLDLVAAMGYPLKKYGQSWVINEYTLSDLNASLRSHLYKGQHNGGSFYSYWIKVVSGSTRVYSAKTNDVLFGGDPDNILNETRILHPTDGWTHICFYREEIGGYTVKTILTSDPGGTGSCVVEMALPALTLGNWAPNIDQHANPIT